MNKKVLIFTGSRADYGLLKNLIIKTKSNKKIQCEILAGSAHYSKYYGLTFKEIERDDIQINYSIKKNYDNLFHDKIAEFVMKNKKIKSNGQIEHIFIFILHFSFLFKRNKNFDIKNCKIFQTVNLEAFNNLLKNKNKNYDLKKI